MAAIVFLKRNRLADLLVYRSQNVNHPDLNILQAAVTQGMEKLVRYILTDHKYLSRTTRHQVTVDPVILLAPAQDAFSLALPHQSLFTYLLNNHPELLDLAIVDNLVK